MKKNLLYLWALICSVSLLTACSSDDDNTVNDETTPPEEEAVVTAPDVVGTYWGNLDISMLPDGSDQEVVIADGLPKFITFSQVSDTEVKMELKEFELFINGNILKFGDIVIDKCAVKKETDASTFTVKFCRVNLRAYAQSTSWPSKSFVKYPVTIFITDKLEPR